MNAVAVSLGRANRSPTGDEVRGAIAEFTAKCGNSREAEAIGEVYCSWRHAVRLFERNISRIVNPGRHDTAGGASSAVGTSVARPSPTPVVSRGPVLAARDKARTKGVFKHTVGGGGPVDVRLWKTLGQWLSAVGRWSYTDLAANHTARHILGLVEGFMAGKTTATANALARADGQAVSELKATVIRDVAAVRRGEAVDTRKAVGIAGNLMRKAISEGHARRKKDVDDWLAEALTKGAKKAHRFAKQDLDGPPLQLAFYRGTGHDKYYVTDPDEVANWHAEPWVKLWGCREKEDADDEVLLIKERRARLKEDAELFADGIDWGPTAIRRACRTFAKDTAIGADDTAFHEVADLPDDALCVLGGVFKWAVAQLTLPHGALLNVLNLLGKKGGAAEPLQQWPPSTASSFASSVMTSPTGTWRRRAIGIRLSPAAPPCEHISSGRSTSSWPYLRT